MNSYEVTTKEFSHIHPETYNARVFRQGVGLDLFPVQLQPGDLLNCFSAERNSKGKMIHQLLPLLGIRKI